MMKILTNPAWYLPLILLMLHQIAQYFLDATHPLIDGYLDPFLGIPVLLGGLLVERGYLFGVERFKILEFFTVTAALVFVLEYVFPAFEPRFVRDGWDLIAYGLGAVYFWFLINPAPATPPDSVPPQPRPTK